MEAPHSPLSSRPERSVVERSVVERTFPGSVLLLRVKLDKNSTAI
jgi:hypothetical protein